MGLKRLLNELAGEAHSKSEKGRLFERLMVAYFKNEPIYKNKFRNVWLWSEWENRTGHDTGIDIVAEEYDGGFCAIQCKFYEPGHSLQKSDIDSFFTASGRSPVGGAPFTSRIIVATSDKWSKNAEDALVGQTIPVSRIDVQSLSESSINWDEYSLDYPDRVKLKPKKHLRPHQIAALDAVVSGFEKSERGKLIMACGTGKTFTSLKIMEKLTSPMIRKLPPSPSATPPSKREALVVFFAPSIALVSQTLKEWTAEISPEINYRSFVVCSDLSVGKKKIDEDIRPYDLACAPTTNAKVLANEILRGKTQADLTIIFSTYQSIGVLSEAQKLGVGEFDLVICDEAHRTTGATLVGDEDSVFVSVHKQDFVKAKRRLYMTATPRIYAETSRAQAKEHDAVLCSMDDETIYGAEFHRLGFGEAVKKDLLSDYKVVILTVDEGFASSAFQKQMTDGSGEMKLDNIVKIVGCWNGLTKRRTHNFGDDTIPMRRAVAFSRSIEDSKEIKRIFPIIAEKCRELTKNAQNENFSVPICEIDHVDGTMDVMTRNAKLDWLKEDFPEGEQAPCRILSNARCLSEGVDVPSLDAVLFLNPRDSVVDVIQSVGRVMRKSPGKKLGYIILPVGIPSDIPPDEALQDNKKYEVVWKVLQALRSHDDRFNAMVNKIDLNKEKPDNPTIIDIGGEGKGETGGNDVVKGEKAKKSLVLPFDIDEWREAIYAKIVLKCGNRRYWEDWASDIAEIAQRQIERIRKILSSSENEIFARFLADLRQDINPNVSEDDAVEMLAQHSITKPVFDALFENYSFADNNPVSRSMQKILDVLNEHITPEESEKLERFYESVRERANGVDNAEGKQRIVIELYDKFFRTAFPQMAERLGIVYTPVEVVDFIIRSADAVLRQEFGKSLESENVHIIDPFTGTGTFIVRLIQSGLISPDALKRKYDTELHANEIVLLAYYIAAINIEEAYHRGDVGYQPFDGIVLTDTFQLYEEEMRHSQHTTDSLLSENSERANKQKNTPIQVIIGNPPYSAGQKNQNDDNQNMKYLNLDNRIRNTYAENSTATNKNSLYDSYIRSIRWATDRISDRGIICYVSNGAFIDGNSADGMRKCLADDFSSIYCFNLRGNQRTSGALSQKEGGKIFGSGSRAGIAISIFVKNPEKRASIKGGLAPCEIFYHDIGDYLSREQKLAKLTELDNVSKMSWEKITPNAKHDWINQRDDIFSTFLLMGSKDDELKNETIFDIHSRGIATSRDAWVYNFSDEKLCLNMARMIEKYDNEVVALNANPNHEICYDQTQIKWTRGLLSDLQAKKRHKYDTSKIVASLYRPFCKQNFYFDANFNDMVYRMPKIFPHSKAENLVICMTGIGVSKDFSVIMSDVVPDVQFMANGQCCPLYTYKKNETQKQPSLFDGENAGKSDGENYTRIDNVNNATLSKFRTTYQDKSITKEDIFYYVYGALHSPEYREKFASNLKKEMTRVPMAETEQEFRKFSQAGRELGHLHVNYENAAPYQLTIEGEQSDFRVSEMKFAKKDGKPDKSTIIYNNSITISDIPLEAYEYIVNGKSAIEWIMERYAVTTHKDSEIKNDPNDWCREHHNPSYIFDLLRKVVTVSVESVRIISELNCEKYKN